MELHRFFRYAIEKMCKEKKSLNHFIIFALENTCNVLCNSIIRRWKIMRYTRFIIMRSPVQSRFPLQQGLRHLRIHYSWMLFLYLFCVESIMVLHSECLFRWDAGKDVSQSVQSWQSRGQRFQLEFVHIQPIRLCP